jgi:hypothetical protein
MILLTSVSDLISLVTSSTADTDVHVSWLDNLSGTVTPGRTNTASIASAATTTIVGSPATSTQRNVKTISIRNRHAATSQTVTVKHTDGTNNLELIKATLAAGEELIYTDGHGWAEYLSSGAVKTSFDPNAVVITGGSITGITDLAIADGGTGASTAAAAATNLGLGTGDSPQLTAVNVGHATDTTLSRAGAGVLQVESSIILTQTLPAGTTGVAPMKFVSGTNMTTPDAGAMEYDGLVHYSAHVAGARGVADSEQFIFTPAADFTLTSQTAAQKMFNSPANGALTVNGSTTYQFECMFDLTTMSATSGAFGWALLGGATFTVIKWTSFANKAALSTLLAWQSTYNANAANTALCTSTTNTVGAALIKGVMRINAGGTIIPAVSLSIAAAAVVKAGSFFRCWPVGNSTVASVGNWS